MAEIQARDINKFANVFTPNFNAYSYTYADFAEWE